MKGIMGTRGLNSFKIIVEEIFSTSLDWSFKIQMELGIISIITVKVIQLDDLNIGVEGSKIEKRLVIMIR